MSGFPTFTFSFYASSKLDNSSFPVATAGDGSAESGGAGEMFQITGEPQNDSQEAWRNTSTRVSEVSTHEGGNSASIVATAGISISELEQMLKQMTFTRSETQRLIAVLHSRTIQDSPSESDGAKSSSPTSPSPLLSLEASTRVLEEQTASPSAPIQDSKLFSNIVRCLPRTPQHPTTTENLPEDLLSNIFIRLLAKQLAQMRCISKSWNALLSQPSFIKSHLDHSIRNNDQILLLFYYEESSSDCQPVTAHTCRSPRFELTNFIKLPLNPQSEYTWIRVIGSVNGLICSSYGDSVIHIWNPSLSAVLALPPYAMPLYTNDSLRVYFRFGFDPKTDDYKVVKLTGLIDLSTGAVTWWLQIDVYSMRKGSWELITSRFPSHITHIADEDHICVDGHDGRLHWVGFIGENMDSETIVAFDLGSETFHVIPLPVQTLDPNVNARSDVLGTLAGKLCVMSWVEDEGCVVWVMDEYGVAESWVKRHVISRFKDRPFPFGFTIRNEFLTELSGFQIVLYDPIVDKAKSFEKSCYDAADKVVEYVDSLVWVTPSEQCIAALQFQKFLFCWNSSCLLS